MGKIEKRGTNSWRVGEQITTENGREWIRRTVTCPADMTDAQQRKQAELELAKLLVDIDAGKAVPGNRLTVRTFAKMYMDEYIIPNTSEIHRSNCQHYLDKRILPELGDLKLEKVTAMCVTKFLNDLKRTPKETTAIPPEKRKRKATAAEIERYNAQQKAEPSLLSGNTVYHYYQFMNAMFEKAVQWEKLGRNPMDRVDPPVKKKTKAKYLTDEQAVDLLRKLALDERMTFRAAVLLGLLCGLRLGEVGALKLSDVDWTNCTVDISRALKYTPDKGSFIGSPKSIAGERLISLPAGMMAVLDETRKYQADIAEKIGDRWHGSGLIVCSWDGSQLNHDTPSKWFRKFADENGYPDIKFHSLRHTHATLLLSSNIDAVAVASRLGHSDATITLSTYAHALRKRDVDAAATMQSLIDKAFEK